MQYIDYNNNNMIIQYNGYNDSNMIIQYIDLNDNSNILNMIIVIQSSPDKWDKTGVRDLS